MNRGKISSEEVFYNDHFQSVMNIAFSHLKNTEDAKDCTHEAFLAVFKKGLSNLDNPEHFLKRAAKNIVIDRLRLKLRQQKFRDYVSLVNIVSTNVNLSLHVEDLHSILENAKDHLTQTQKTVFELSRMDGKTHKEIADILGISKNTVKNHLVSALAKIRRDLESQGISLGFILFIMSIQ